MTMTRTSGRWTAFRLAGRRRIAAALLAGPILACGGCVQVTAPDRPIEIVLTINIRQEVVYRLDDDAKALIEQNTEIF